MMDDRNAQVGWSEAQWNRVREEVLRAWQSVRVAGSFLPAYGGLPRSTQVVPSEMFTPWGTVDERSVAPLMEISLPVRLSRQQVLEEDMASSLLQFRRRATQVGQLEDWFIFNGTYPYEGRRFPDDVQPTSEVNARLTKASYRPAYPFLEGVLSDAAVAPMGIQKPIAGHATQLRGLRARNPGALGLMGGALELQEFRGGGWGLKRAQSLQLDSRGLMKAVVDAMTALEGRGYVSPYVCVFGREPFKRAHDPVGSSIAYPRDRLEPLIGRELLHASAIDMPPVTFDEYDPPTEADWQKRALLLSLAGGSIDLAIAAEATPEFRQVDEQGRYVFSVFERFVLRIKDPEAIVPLRFY
jgi:uncharacterized linocin/CFP29 family protein